MYSITFADGTKLDNLKLNGNNFISVNKNNKEQKLTRDFFTNEKLAQVLIECDTSDSKNEADYSNFNELIGEHGPMELIQLVEIENASWFILANISPEKLAMEKINARLDYIEMMEDL